MFDVAREDGRFIPDTGSQLREALSLGAMRGCQRRLCVVRAQGSGAGEPARSVDLVRPVGSPHVQPLPTLDQARRFRRKDSPPSWFRVSTQPSRHVPVVNVSLGEMFFCCSRARESTETSQACERYVTKVGKLTCVFRVSGARHTRRLYFWSLGVVGVLFYSFHELI